MEEIYQMTVSRKDTVLTVCRIKDKRNKCRIGCVVDLIITDVSSSAITTACKNIKGFLPAYQLTVHCCFSGVYSLPRDVVRR